MRSSIVKVVDEVLSPWLGKVGSREMETFTTHDRLHGLKVAHLMWHIFEPSRRNLLTPPEIAMLVMSAYLHDIGMALTADERAARLLPESDLWVVIEAQEKLGPALERLRQACGNTSLSPATRRLAKQRLDQAEEALLCHDTRRRHASAERYREVLENLDAFHHKDPAGVAAIDSALRTGAKTTSQIG